MTPVLKKKINLPKEKTVKSNFESAQWRKVLLKHLINLSRIALRNYFTKDPLESI